MRKFALYIVLSFIGTQSFAQVLGVDFGGGKAFSSVERVSNNGALSKTGFMNHISPAIYYQQHLFKDLYFNLGGRYERYSYGYFHNDATQTTNGDFVDFDFTHNVRNLSMIFGLHREITNFKENLRLYGQLDAKVNFFNTNSQSFTDDFNTATIFQVNTQIPNSTTIGFKPEIGLKKKLSDKADMFFYASYTFGGNNAATANYQTSGAATDVDFNLSSKNNNVFIGAKVQVNFYNEEKAKQRQDDLIAKREERNRIKEEQHKQKMLAKEKVPETKKDTNNTILVELDDQGLPEKIDNRPVKQKKEVEIKKKSITINVWDHHTVDNDTISLYVNGECVIKQQMISSEKITVDVKLKDGNNYLVLYAHNLGRVGKNTAAIQIQGAKHSKKIHKLESSLGYCDAINLTTKKTKKKGGTD